jgi:hypothetical protein
MGLVIQTLNPLVMASIFPRKQEEFLFHFYVKEVKEQSQCTRMCQLYEYTKETQDNLRKRGDMTPSENDTQKPVLRRA